MAKRKRRPNRKSRRPLAATAPWPVMSGLTDANTLIQQNRWREAVQLLEELDQDYPNRLDILTTLADVYHQTNDLQNYLAVSVRLRELDPDDPDVVLSLAGAYMINVLPVLAWQSFRQFLEQWPQHRRADEVKETIHQLEERVDEFLVEMNLSGEKGYEVAAMHEEVQVLFARQKYNEGRELAEKLLERQPHFVPALNNISQTYYIEGDLEQAIATARRVLEFEPDNYHALSNLTRYLCLSGQKTEAGQTAEQLKKTESERIDLWIKKAEALTYLGDDRGVLDAFEGAKQSNLLEPPLGDPLLYHLAAVAAMRLDNKKQAIRYWEQALKIAPGLHLAAANLADLQQPVSEQHAPWPFYLSNWLPGQIVEELRTRLASLPKGANEERITEMTRDFLRRHPEVENIIPTLLERGDPQARQLALTIATFAEMPVLIEALRDFALSRHGPDKLRHQAAQTASQAGAMPAGQVRMWLEGEWRDIVLMGFEIYFEPKGESPHAPKVMELMKEGIEATNDDDYERAERLLKQALADEPDAPDLMNNLAVCYVAQGRIEDAETLLHKIYQEHPDYFFGRIGMANLLVQRGEFEQAEEILQELLSEKRLHISEFAALCQAHILLYDHSDRPESAETWFKMWYDVDPESATRNRWVADLE